MREFENKEIEKLEGIKKEYQKIFKNSKVTWKYGCFGKDTIYINFYLARNENEVSLGYLANDCFKISFEIEKKENDVFSLENLQKSIRVKPESKYMYCSSVQVPFRKTQGNLEKLEKSLIKFFEKTKTILIDNYNNENLLDKDKYLVKEILL